MSSSLEDGAARRSRKVTERPSGLDEPLVQMLSGIGFGWNAEPGAFRCPRRSLLPAVSSAGGASCPGRLTPCPPKSGHPHWGQRRSCHPAYLQRCTSWGTRGGGGLVTTRIRNTGVDRNSADGPPPPVFSGRNCFLRAPIRSCGRLSSRPGRGSAFPTGRLSCAAAHHAPESQPSSET